MMRSFLFAAAGLLISPLSLAQAAGDPPATAASSGPATAASTAPRLPVLPPLPPINETAFQAIEQTMMPLTPEQIRQLHQKIDATDRAAAAPPRFVPRPVSSSMVAVLSPGATPPVVRLFPNYVTNILFVDEAGSPLTVETVDIPNKSDFTVTWGGGKSAPGNDVTVSPNTMYAMGNIAVHLIGVQVPIPVMLVSGQREIDTRAAIRIAGVGVQPSEKLPQAADARLQQYLDNVPPPGAEALTASSPSVQVWSDDGDFVVRMGPAQSLLSPAWLQHKSSPDGTTVYVIPPMSPIMTLSDGGQSLSITVSGY